MRWILLIILLVGCQPSAVDKIIEEQKANPVADPPAVISECQYNGQIVFYLPPRCCDIPSKLYNEKGDVICEPDGGITGKGDCEDFSKSQCVPIWQDTRKLI